MPSVLITGANRGIGFGLVKAYLGDGWQVIATCRNPGAADGLRALDQENLEIFPLDVTDHPGIDALAEKLKGRAIDVLINNAGILGSPTFENGGAGQTLGDMDYDGFRHTLEVNTIAPLKVTEALLPNLELGEQKKLITITSNMGSIETMEDGFVAYRTSKSAVNAIMRTLSFGLKEKGIMVAVLHPGWVRTDMGGPDAPVSIAESAAGLKLQIEKMDISSSGTFRNFQGETHPF